MNKYELFLGAYVMYVGEVYVVNELYAETCKIENRNWGFVCKYEFLRPVKISSDTKYVHDLQRAYQLATGKCLEKRLGTN